MTYWGSSFRKINEKELDRAGEFILQLACLVTVLHGIVSHGKMITFYSNLMVPSTCSSPIFQDRSFQLLINHLRHLPLLKDLSILWPVVFPDKMYDLTHCPKLRPQEGLPLLLSTRGLLNEVVH